jgi:isoquinoline 1-oxidoreductase beta subunit
MNPWMRAAVRAELGLDREAPGVDRRGFFQIIASATGGLWLATQLPSLAAAADAPAAPAPQLYIHIGPDNRVTLMIPNSEVGQGVRTSLALLIAEELEADWSQIQVETAPYDPRYGDQGAGGSSSVWSRFEPLRQVGAAMRTMLIGAAAARWRVPVAQLRAENSQVIHAPSGRRVTFGELVGAAARQPVPAHPPLRPRDQSKLAAVAPSSRGRSIDANSIPGSR